MKNCDSDLNLTPVEILLFGHTLALSCRLRSVCAGSRRAGGRGRRRRHLPGDRSGSGRAGERGIFSRVETLFRRTRGCTQTLSGIRIVALPVTNTCLIPVPGKNREIMRVHYGNTRVPNRIHIE